MSENTTWVWHGTNAATGNFRKGEMVAEDREQVRSHLEGMGIVVISIDVKGAAPSEQSDPKFPAPKANDVPPSAEAVDRVNSTIAAMSNIAEMLPAKDRPHPYQPEFQRSVVQEIVCDKFEKIQERVRERLEAGARVVHVNMNHDAQGHLQVLIVLEKERE